MLPKDSLHDAAAWFDLLTTEQQDRVQRDVAVTQYAAGAIIERKGEKAYAWIGVLAGLVKVSVGNSDGKMASLTGVPAGGWIGEGSLLKREARKIGRASWRERVCRSVSISVVAVSLPKKQRDKQI